MLCLLALCTSQRTNEMRPCFLCAFPSFLRFLFACQMIRRLDPNVVLRSFHYNKITFISPSFLLFQYTNFTSRGYGKEEQI